MEIAEFARAVKKGQVRAVDAARDQVDVEGAPFWLCQVIEDAFQAIAPVVFAGDSFDEGYYLVKVRWYEFAKEENEKRLYRLIGDERMLSVHSLVRCDPVRLKILEPTANARGRPPAYTATRALHELSQDECARIALMTVYRTM